MRGSHPVAPFLIVVVSLPLLARAALVTHDTVVPLSLTVVPPGEHAQKRLQEALILAPPGGVVELKEGRYTFSEGLSLDVESVTLRGAGMHKTILSFENQRRGSEGLLITSDKVIVEDLAVEDTRGNGIKVTGVNEITMRRVRVEWTRGPNPTNGAYGLYPVKAKNVLIDAAVVRGASDAGIYVGQSQWIIVRGSQAEENVAGLKIENSHFVDVHGNVMTRNAEGIMILGRPNLPQEGCHSVRVFSNKIVSNNTPNFAPPGDSVGTPARGTGLHIMAARNVEVFGNEIGDHATVNVLISAYPLAFEDSGYRPYPRGIVVHDNRYGKAGFDPSDETGSLLAARTGMPVPDVVWDGMIPLREWLLGTAAVDRVYFKEAEGTTFANLRMASESLLPWQARVDRRMARYTGALPRLPSVQLPQEKVRP